MTTNGALLTVLGPAILAVLGLWIGNRWRTFARDAAVAGGLLVLGASIVELTGLLRGEAVARINLLGSIDTGSIRLNLELRSDQLSALTSIMVALVALCVQVYSTAYFAPANHHDHVSPDRYASFAATVSLFTAAMMLVVHAGDLVLLIIGWEGMGICSYLLVGYYSERETARAAAVKAFVVTRVGDIGVLLAAVLLITQAHTTSIAVLTERVHELPQPVLATAALLLLAGVAGKSAQFPLHTWLPDAMEGPTPISALIHAATMVAAGVFLVIRMLPVFLAGPGAMQVAAVMAAITMLGAALVALAQDDLKKLLAWSTISQVAYMLAAASVAGRNGITTGPALFHLISHGAFKALLFLAAGCIAHVYSGSTRLSDMGGLLRTHPGLAWVFGLGLAGLAGLPPFGGFWSKESVLSAAEAAALGGQGWPARLLVGSGVVTALITGLYAGRAFAVVAMTPAGTSPPPKAERTADGSLVKVPRAMMGVLWVLAVPTALVGLLLLAHLKPLEGTEIDVVTAFTGSLLSLAGVGWGLTAARLGANDVADALPVKARAFLRAGYRLDDVQDRLVVRPVLALARLVARADTAVVDAPVRGLSASAERGGGALAPLAGPRVTNYAAWALGGAVVFALIGVVLS